MLSFRVCDRCSTRCQAGGGDVLSLRSGPSGRSSSPPTTSTGPSSADDRQTPPGGRAGLPCRRAGRGRLTCRRRSALRAAPNSGTSAAGSSDHPGARRSRTMAQPAKRSHYFLWTWFTIGPAASALIIAGPVVGHTAPDADHSGALFLLGRAPLGLRFSSSLFLAGLFLWGSSIIDAYQSAVASRAGDLERAAQAPGVPPVSRRRPRPRRSSRGSAAASVLPRPRRGAARPVGPARTAPAGQLGAHQHRHHRARQAARPRPRRSRGSDRP